MHTEEQLTFFEVEEHARARHSDPPTSREAAESIDTTRIERIVYKAIRRAGRQGLIAADLPWHTGLALNTVTPRTKPLREKGLIEDSGERRPGPSGRMQIVWKAV